MKTKKEVVFMILHVILLEIPYMIISHIFRHY